MMSGILWIPDLQVCMLTFLIKAEFVNTTKCYKVIGTKFPHMKKLEIAMNKMFLLFRVGNHKRTMLYILSVLTSDSAFQSALLHSCIDNTLNLSTPVIGSYKTWCIPPVIIFQS